jgi:quinol monooxygenase YgiN
MCPADDRRDKIGGTPMKYTVTITGRLRDDPAAAKKYHDDVTKATKEAAKQAGDINHAVYLDPKDPKAFFGIDTWSSLEGLQGFAGSPQIREFFGKLFEAQPDVHVWVASDWNQW